MFQAFMADTSHFKSRLVLCIFLSVLSLGASFYLFSMSKNQMIANNQKEAEYQAQASWLSKFDYQEANHLYQMVLKPALLKDLDSVQADQISILKKHHLQILSVKNAALSDKPDKKIPLKYRKSTVVLSGSWTDIMAALQEFETKHLVVITNSSFSSNDPNVPGMKVTLDYHIYFK